jgi:hypothetical protein
MEYRYRMLTGTEFVDVSKPPGARLTFAHGVAAAERTTVAESGVREVES